MKPQTKLSALFKCVASAAISLSCLATAHAQEPKIGFVNTERIFHEAIPAKKAEAKIAQEFSKREKELRDVAARLKGMSEKLDKESAVLPEAERGKRSRELAELDKDFQRKKNEFGEDLKLRRDQEMAIFRETTTKAIQQITDAEKYDIVFQEAVTFSPRIDITDKVLKALNK